MVDLGGIEPPTFAMRMQRSSQLSYRPRLCLLMLSGPDGSRTHDLFYAIEAL